MKISFARPDSYLTARDASYDAFLQVSVVLVMRGSSIVPVITVKLELRHSHTPKGHSIKKHSNKTTNNWTDTHPLIKL